MGCIVYSGGGWVGDDVFSGPGAVAFGVILGGGRAFAFLTSFPVGW